jgi:hypothetical protein
MNMRVFTNHLSTPFIPHSWGNLEIGGHPQISRQRGFAPLNSPLVNDLINIKTNFKKFERSMKEDL